MKINGANWEEKYGVNKGLLINSNDWDQQEVFTYMGGYDINDTFSEMSAAQIMSEIDKLESSGRLTAAVDKNGDGEITGSEIDTFCKNAGGGNFISEEARDRVKNTTIKEALDAKEDNKINTGRNNGTIQNYRPESAKQSALTTLNKTLANIADNDPKIVEIKSKITEKQSELSGYQTELAAINNGTDSEIAGLKEAEDKAYVEYQAKMEEVSGAGDIIDGMLGGATASKIDAKKGEVEAKQGEIDSKITEISAQEGVVSSCETEVANAESNVTTCEASVSTLEGQLASVADDDKDAKSTIQFQLSLARNALAQAKAEKLAADTALETAKKELETLNTDKEKLEKEHADLEKELKELQDEFEKKHPEVTEAREAWEKAKEATETRKAEKAAEVQAKIDKAQGELNDLEVELQEAQNNKTSQRLGTSNLGDDIVNFAEGYLGLNEADGSADMFLEDTKADNTVNDPNAKYTSKGTHWCAAYVEYIMENNPSASGVADWYTEIGNKWYCPTIYNAAKENDAVISGEEAQKGDIVLFDWQANGSDKDHIGIYAGVENGQAVIIEGNTGNAKVEKRYYDLNDPRLTYCTMRA